MAKFTKIAALFTLLLVFIANAYAYRTIVTTVEVDEENPGRQQESEKCRRQMQRQDFSHCERFLSQSRSLEAMPEVDNPRQQEQQHLQQCCQQFRQLDEDCQCEAFEHMVRRQQQRERGQGQQQFEQRARQMQSQCNLPPQCQFRPIWF